MRNASTRPVFVASVHSEHCCLCESDLINFDVLLTVRFSIFILVINQPDVQNFFYDKFSSYIYMFIRKSKLCYFDLLTMSTWCSKHVEAWNKFIAKQILCIKLVNFQDKYTEMYGQQNIKIYQIGFVKAAVFWVDRRNKNRAGTRVSHMLWELMCK